MAVGVNLGWPGIAPAKSHSRFAQELFFSSRILKSTEFNLDVSIPEAIPPNPWVAEVDRTEQCTGLSGHTAGFRYTQRS
jgi:hypothetical protein